MAPIASLVDQLLAACATGAVGGMSLTLALLLTGLAAGFTHCAVQCGPLLLARAGAGGMVRFHLGRLVALAALGGSSAALSRMILGDPAQRMIAMALMLAAGLLLILEGAFRLPVTAALGLADLRWRPESWSFGPFLSGAAFALMPCGMLIAALMASAAAPGAGAGALAMLAFGLGTLPGLLMISGVGAAVRLRWPHVARPLSTVALLGSGAFLFILATTVIA